MLTADQKTQFDGILEELGKSIDITQTQYEAAETSYNAVGSWLSAKESSLAPYSPQILPQGSFLLGTMVRPIGEDGELDIDLVCRLDGKHPTWAQAELKKKVGDRIKDNKKYEGMLKEEGRRCWTLGYKEDSKFHLDILPALLSSGYKDVFEKALSDTELSSEGVAIRITDKTLLNYKTETSPENWPKSNPFGYAGWFNNRAKLTFEKSILLSETVKPVPPNKKNKLPLHRVVQILKRHRDITYGSDDDRPISIIITTLAARAYSKETSLVDGLVNILSRMENFIEERFDAKSEKMIKWIPNPVNEVENFADKWVETSRKQRLFYTWLKKAKQDFQEMLNTTDIPAIAKKAEELLGKRTVTEAFSALGKNILKVRENKSLIMEKGTGILKTSIGSAASVPVKGHNFHGNDSTA